MFDETDMMTCAFCGATVPDVDAAVEAGWEPYFWITETVTGDGSVCPQCSREHLRDHSNDPIIKPGHKHFLRSNREAAL
jgi:hypothetical protein